MRVENRQPLQPIGQNPRDWHDAPGDGWREGDAVNFITAIGEDQLSVISEQSSVDAGRAFVDWWG